MAEQDIRQTLSLLCQYPFLAETSAAFAHPVDVKGMRDLLSHINRQELQFVVTRRNENKKCGYLLCKCPNRQYKRSSLYQVVKIKTHPLYNHLVPTAILEQWCSEPCRLRGEHLAAQIPETRAPGMPPSGHIEEAWYKTFALLDERAVAVQRREVRESRAQRKLNQRAEEAAMTRRKIDQNLFAASPVLDADQNFDRSAQFTAINTPRGQVIDRAHRARLDAAATNQEQVSDTPGAASCAQPDMLDQGSHQPSTPERMIGQMATSSDDQYQTADENIGSTSTVPPLPAAPGLDSTEIPFEQIRDGDGQGCDQLPCLELPASYIPGRGS